MASQQLNQQLITSTHTGEEEITLTKASVSSAASKAKGMYSSAPQRDEEDPYARTSAPSSSSSSAPPKKKVSSSVSSVSTLPPVSVSSSSSSSSPSTGVTAAEFAAREKELRDRESKLLAMEQQLEKRTAEVEKHAGKMKNWPCSCLRLVYHDIAAEIPQTMQSIVRKFYFFWCFMSLLLVYNWVTVLIIWGTTGDMELIDIPLATFYVIAGVPLSWIMWYWPFYKTMRSKSSVSWSFFIMGFGIHWLWVVCMGISVPYFESGGILTFIKVLVSGDAFPIIICLINMLWWGLGWIGTGYLTKKARDEYKRAGQNLSALKGGIVGEAIKMQIKG